MLQDTNLWKLPAVDMELKNRNIILQFTGENGEKTIDGLNIRFSVRQVCYAFGSQAQISIFNLSMQDVNYLTLFSPFFSSKKRNTVKISAGYDNNIQPIFEGDVWQALPTKWLEARRLPPFCRYQDKACSISLPF